MSFCAISLIENQEKPSHRVLNKRFQTAHSINTCFSCSQELRHSFNITTLSASAMPAQEEVPEFTKHAIPLAHDLTNLSRVLLQALGYGLGKKKKVYVSFYSLEIQESLFQTQVYVLLFFCKFCSLIYLFILFKKKKIT